MKRWIAMLLVLCLTALCLLPSAMAAEKNEIVYVNLRPSGELDAVYIVNRFEASSAETIVDYGSYYKVANLSNTTPLEQNADSVRLTVPEGTLFYQGDPVSASLPWSIRVSYALDGVPIRAEELSGRSGALEMQITIGKGSESLTDFFEHYALNMTVTLDGERCSGITAEGATIANSGTDRLLTYVVDAGVDSLASGADTLLDGASSLSSGANSLKGGVNELSEGTSDMDEQVQKGVDDAISSITGGDFEPISYADPRNRVESVQFVIRIPGVSEAEEPEIVVEEEAEKSLGEKFLDLFR